jgi:hypothetical protein
MRVYLSDRKEREPAALKLDETSNCHQNGQAINKLNRLLSISMEKSLVEILNFHFPFIDHGKRNV